MFKNCCTALASLAFILLLTTPASAVDRYVQKTGSSDANACTLAAPCLTITEGLNKAQASEILYIRAGTYVEGGMGINDFGLTVRNFPGDTVIVRPYNIISQDSGSPIFNVNNANVTIEGLIIDGGDGGTTKWWAYLVQADNENNLTLRNNEIKWSHRSCILTSGTGHLYEGNNIHDCGIDIDLDHSIYYSGSNTIMKNNRVANGEAYNMQCYSTCSNVTLDGNTWTGSRLGMSFNNGSGNIFKNNIMYDDAVGFSDTGLRCLNDSGLKVWNNTFWNTNIQFRSDCSGSLEFRNNIRANGSEFSDETGTVVSSNNLTSDPGFVNPAGQNFHLSSGATAAINTGITIGSVTTDFEGTTRPQGAGYDIGADEFTSGVEPQRHLGFIIEPSNVVTGQNMTPGILIEVHFPDHTVDTGSTDAITITFVGCAGTMTCGGGCTQNAVAGSRTFNALSFNTAGTGCSLNAAATFATGGSDSEPSVGTFTISAPPVVESGDMVRIKGKGGGGFFLR